MHVYSSILNLDRVWDGHYHTFMASRHIIYAQQIFAYHDSCLSGEHMCVFNLVFNVINSHFMYLPVKLLCKV